MTCCFTGPELASGRSILLIDTASGALAWGACAMASTVVGITPSSAASAAISQRLGREASRLASWALLRTCSAVPFSQRNAGRSLVLSSVPRASMLGACFARGAERGPPWIIEDGSGRAGALAPSDGEGEEIFDAPVRARGEVSDGHGPDEGFEGVRLDEANTSTRSSLLARELNSSSKPRRGRSGVCK